MKIKAVLMTSAFLMGLLGLIFMAPQQANCSGLLWTNVTINRIIQTETNVQVRPTEVGVADPFSNKLFNISNEKQNAMLAILLTAMSLDKNVRIAFYDGTPALIILVGTIN